MEPELAVYLRAPVVRRYLQDVTISVGGRATASAKQKGRAIANCSFAGEGDTPLNTPAVKVTAAAAHWSETNLPVIGAYTRIIIEFFEKAKAAARAAGELEMF
jgi:hypothetical protein